MSYRSKFMKLCKFGAAGGLVTAVTVQLLDGDKQSRLGSKFTLFAKNKEFSKVNDLHHGMGIKWDSNWDKRYRWSIIILFDLIFYSLPEILPAW